MKCSTRLHPILGGYFNEVLFVLNCFYQPMLLSVVLTKLLRIYLFEVFAGERWIKVTFQKTTDFRPTSSILKYCIPGALILLMDFHSKPENSGVRKYLFYLIGLLKVIRRTTENMDEKIISCYIEKWERGESFMLG